MENNQGTETKLTERDLCDCGSHKWMAVPVSTNPGAEADFWKTKGIGYESRIKARASPSFAETGIETRKGWRKNLAQVIKHSPALGGDIRFLQQDFPCPPETLQDHLELLAQSQLLIGRK
jgi:hypothetical protein